MSGYTWAAFIPAAAVTVLSVVASLLGIWESMRNAESPRFTYRRTMRVWAVGIALWGVAGVVRGVVDHQWVEAAVIIATAVFMTWVIAPSKKKVH